MVTVKISKRKRVRSKDYLKRGLPFLVVGLVIIVGGLLIIDRIYEESGYIKWIWFVVSFLVFQYVNFKYIVRK
ncbi:MAG: hypothetical protein KO464_09175 [Candidatus Methanofastidiosum sp.]|nr:hypothetical protein [Methanofastidiosum sp.]